MLGHNRIHTIDNLASALLVTVTYNKLLMKITYTNRLLQIVHITTAIQASTYICMHK
jgi:hypothetical protein